MIDLTSLDSAPRLLVESALEPLQGHRFQPTGFPDLGPATYELPDGTPLLIVESHLPYVAVEITDGRAALAKTSSLLEAHRLNSPYVLHGVGPSGPFAALFQEACDYREGKPIDRKKFVTAALRYDPGSLLHGVFMSNVGDSRMRLARAVSCAVEARGTKAVASGGVKNDRVNPSGATKEGFGNVPFARTEFVAEAIRLFFSLDLEQIRSYGFGAAETRLLQLLALFKLQRLLSSGMRFRTFCDFQVTGVSVTAPGSFALPSLDALESEMPAAISACAAMFADPRVTKLSFKISEAYAKQSKKAAKAGKEAKGDEAGENS